jgi:type IV pilus assembly protein PilM
VFAADHILALNVGAGKLALAEFSVRQGRVPVLLNYGFGEFGMDPENESASSAFLIAALKDVMNARGIRPAPLLMAVSGQLVFPRFPKMPPVSKDKLVQMIQLDAEQNVPFPITELVWDYQLIGGVSEGEQNVMIVAAKNETVTELIHSVVEAGLDPEVIDVAPMALYNCVRYNYPDLDGCSMIVDIGARSTNLVFIEEGRFFSRCIPVAGNAITQELAKSFQIGHRAAEALKRECAFVALGGVFAPVGDERADRVSKVVRNVITRLHAEISRSIAFYRSQQGGSAPNRVFLTGGSSVIPHMNTFFADKLQVEVQYLNPFLHVALAPPINTEQLGRDAFMLAEVIGLALRRKLACPVEINLLPPALARRKTFRRRIPYFGLAAAGLVLTAGVWTIYTKGTLKLYERQAQQVEERVNQLRNEQKKLDAARAQFTAVQKEADAIRGRIAGRTQLVRAMDAIRECLFPGMWLTSIEPVRNPQGELVQLRLSGRGWVDRLKELENKNDGPATAVELFRDQLKMRPIFATDGVKITNEREEADGSVRGFVVEAALSPIS